MKEIDAIEREEAALKARRERVGLEAELAGVEAEEKALREVRVKEKEITHLPRVREHTSPDVSGSERPMHLNTEAPEIGLSGCRCSGENDQRDLSNREVMQALISCNLKSLMPKQDIVKFDGDRTKYFKFIRAFDEVFSSQLTNDKERLRYLDLYTTGMPNDIVASCIHLEASEGYKQARKLLEERYGNLEQIATAFVEKIIKWKDIRENNAEEYDEYSVALKTCRNAISCVPYGIAELQNPKTMRLIIGKFSLGVQARWWRVADKINEKKKRPVSFDDLEVEVVQGAEVVQEVEVIGSEHSNRALVAQEEGTHDKIAMFRATLGSTERQDVKVNVETINGVGKVACSLVSGLSVLDYEGKTCITLPPVLSAPRIPIDECDVVRSRDLERWPHLREIYIPEVEAEVGLLIGNNAPHLLEPREVINSTRLHEPHAIRTLLGWVVCGAKDKRRQEHFNKIQVTSKCLELDRILVESYNREYDDVASNRREMSAEDRKWLEIIEKGVRKKGRTYEVPLPLRGNHGPLPETRDIALRRMHILRKKLVKDDKPDKVRVVFDCASKVEGISLNDLLLQGPDMMNSLLGVLVKFRGGLFAYTGDINTMFYQKLDYEGLCTLFCEVEATVNSRPLTVVTSDNRDPVPLTPNKLLNMADSPVGCDVAIGGHSKQRWKQVQHMAEQFWARWKREYLLGLQKRQKWLKERRNVRVGDVVLMVKENEARCYWPLARVVQTKVGKDGLVRTVTVRREGKEYDRPLSKLILILEEETDLMGVTER
ncbi:uncharacterized protein [Palaemon carinicauda]|uniref:uncharacterized protein n=1 Tax=Palaemon carinicauda TaxID=392227 RepID=UPI0035B59B2F